MEGFARRLAIPESLYRLSVGVGLRHPVMSRHVALMAGSIFLAWVDLSQTGHAYSADEKQRAKAVKRRVSGLALHLVPSKFADNVVSCTDFGFGLRNMGLKGEAAV